MQLLDKSWLSCYTSINVKLHTSDDTVRRCIESKLQARWRKLNFSLDTISSVTGDILLLSYTTIWPVHIYRQL